MKKFNLKGVFEGFRSSMAHSSKQELEFHENLKPYHFFIKRTFHHGFPYEPTAMAYDPIQNLLAIGTKNGSLRIIGQPGVDVYVRHDLDEDAETNEGIAVIALDFSMNDGHLISVTSNNTIHLWNYRQKPPQVVQSLKFQKEKITCIHLPMQSKWLYVGTDRGNVHIVQVESFTLSGYVINWNKAIEISQKTHPGSIIHLSDNPLDTSKLLIGFETGLIVLWDLKCRTTDFRCQTSEPICSISWHHDGKQFLCSQIDGCIACWNLKQNDKPVHIFQPHGKNLSNGNKESCRPITKVKWTQLRNRESFIVFIGGLPSDQYRKGNPVSVINSVGTTVLDMENSVVDFIVISENPWNSELKPQILITLTQNDLVLMDLQKNNYPLMENPYAMDIHESPVSYVYYLAACPDDLIPVLYSVGRSISLNKKVAFSDREWPINGGQWSIQSSSYSEIIITGHLDGSLKFWDASAGNLQILYKLKTAKLFEKPTLMSAIDNQDEDLFAIQFIALCPETRKLCVANTANYVIVFKFQKTEKISDIFVIEVPLNVDEDEIVFEDDNENNHREEKKDFKSLTVILGPQKRSAGFQPKIICVPFVTKCDQSIPQITSLEIHSSYGLMAFGHEYGLVIIDIIQKICIFNMRTQDICFVQEPSSYRNVRSPKKTSQGGETGDQFDETVQFNQSIDYINGSSNSQSTGASTNAPGSSIFSQIRSKPEQPRRSRSQGTRKLNKCLSTASYSEDTGSSLSATTHRHQNLLVARQYCSFDKLDNPFSRSRSSSTNSLEQITSESITTLTFACSYILKNEPCSLVSTLWIGTNFGTVLTIILSLPPSELRESQTIGVTTAGATMFRLKGSIISIRLLDFNQLISLNTSEGNSKKPSNHMSPTNTESKNDTNDKQFVIVTSEKQIRVYTLPSHCCLYRHQVSESDFVVKSEIMFLTDGACLVGYLSNGHIVAYSLPSLNILVDVEFLPLSELSFQIHIKKGIVDPMLSIWGQQMFCKEDTVKLSKIFCFTNRGHGLYLSSLYEIQKFTISAEFYMAICDTISDLWISNEMPEQPKEGFLKGLFGVGQKQLDREILFGESSGKGSNLIAKIVPGSLTDAQQKSGTAASEISKAHQAVFERGEKLNQLEERAQRMASEAERFSQTAQVLMNKYKNQKWYQL